MSNYSPNTYTLITEESIPSTALPAAHAISGLSVVSQNMEYNNKLYYATVVIRFSVYSNKWIKPAAQGKPFVHVRGTASSRTMNMALMKAKMTAQDNAKKAIWKEQDTQGTVEVVYSEQVQEEPEEKITNNINSKLHTVGAYEDILKTLIKHIRKVESGSDKFNARGNPIKEAITILGKERIDVALGAQQMMVSKIVTLCDTMLTKDTTSAKLIIDFRDELVEQAIDKENENVIDYYSEELQTLFHLVFLLENIYSSHPRTLYTEVLLLKNLGGGGAYGAGTRTPIDILKSHGYPYKIRNKIGELGSKPFNSLKDGSYRNFLNSKRIAPFFMNPSEITRSVNGYTDTNGNTINPIFSTNYVTVYDKDGKRKQYNKTDGYEIGNTVIYLDSVDGVFNKDTVIYLDESTKNTYKDKVRDFVILLLHGSSEELTAVTKDKYGKHFDDLFLQMTVPDAATMRTQMNRGGTWYTDTPVYMYTWKDFDPTVKRSGEFWTMTYHRYLTESGIYSNLLSDVQKPDGSYKTKQEVIDEILLKEDKESRRKSINEFIDKWTKLDKKKLMHAAQNLICNHYMENIESFRTSIDFKALETLVLRYSFKDAVTVSSSIYTLRKCYENKELEQFKTDLITIQTNSSAADTSEVGGQVSITEEKEALIEIADSTITAHTPVASESTGTIVPEVSLNDTINTAEVFADSNLTVADIELQMSLIDTNSAGLDITKVTSSAEVDTISTVIDTFNVSGEPVRHSPNYPTLSWSYRDSSLALIMPSDSPDKIESLTVTTKQDTATWDSSYAALLDTLYKEDPNTFKNIIDTNIVTYGIPDSVDGSFINVAQDSVAALKDTDSMQVALNITAPDSSSIDSVVVEEPETSLDIVNPMDVISNKIVLNVMNSTLSDPRTIDNEENQQHLGIIDPMKNIGKKIILNVMNDTISDTQITYNNTDSGEVIVHTLGQIYNLPTSFNFPTVDVATSGLTQFGVTGDFVKELTPVAVKKKYERPKDPEGIGILYIGDILTSTPPVNMRFSFVNETMSIPTMRTKGDPITSTNNSIPKVNLTLYFTGKKQINEQLRPLVALYQNMPFTTIQNTTIHDSWIGRREQQDTKADTDIDRFAPVPCYLENINFSTVPGFPNTIQAHLSIIMMEILPLSAGMLYWKTTEDALKQAMNKGIRQSISNVILSSSDKEVSDNTITKNDSKLEVLLSTGEVVTLDIPDQRADNNPDKVTIYPQESFPFSKMYRNRLVEEKGDYSRVVKNKIIHWNEYEEEDNKDIYITYRSPKVFEDTWTRFRDRFNKVTQNINDISFLFSIVGQGLSEESDIAELFGTSPGLGLLDAVETMVESMSVMKTWEEATKVMNEAFVNMIYEVKGSIGNLYTTWMIPARIGDETKNVTLEQLVENADVELEFINSNGEVNEPVKDILKALDELIKQDIDNRAENQLPDSLKFVEIIIEKLINDPILDDQTASNSLNYRRVRVKLGWDKEPKTGNIKNLVTTGKFPGDGNYKLAGGIAEYNFQSVVQSISYSYANTFTPQFVASSNRPMYQHMGVSNAIATITLRTRDERLLKILADIREAAHTVGSQLLSGNDTLIGFDSISITGKYDEPYSGHLLNCFGFKDCNITNIDSRSIEGHPGWWEVSIDVVENNNFLRAWETLTAVPTLDTNVLSTLQKYTFPLPYAIPSGEAFSSDFVTLPIDLALSIESKEKILESILNEIVDKLVEVDSSGLIEYYLILTGFIGTSSLGNKLGIKKLDKVTSVKVTWTGSTYRIQQGSLKENSINYAKAFEPWIEQLSSLTKLYESYDTYLESNSDSYPKFEQQHGDLPDRTIKFGIKATMVAYYIDIIRKSIYIIDSVLPEILNKVKREVGKHIKALSDLDLDLESFTKNSKLLLKYGEAGKPFDHNGTTPWIKFPIGLKRTKGLRYELSRAVFIDPTDTTFTLNQDTFRLQSVIFSNSIQKKLLELIRRQDYRELVDLNKAKFGLDDTTSIKDLISELNRSIKPNYPDLNLADLYIKSTGTQLMSPTFCYVDTDPDLEIIEMEKSLNMLRATVATQVAALWGTINYGNGCSDPSYDDKESCIEADESWDDRGYSILKDMFVDSNKNNTDGFNLAMDTINRYSTSKGRAVRIPGYLLDEDNSEARKDPKNIKASKIFSSFDEMMQLVNLQKKTRSKEEQDANPLSIPMSKGYQGLSKDSLMHLMSLTSLLDYVITIMAISPQVSDLSSLQEFQELYTKGELVELKEKLIDNTEESIKGGALNTKKLSELFKNILAPDFNKQDMTIDNENYSDRFSKLIFEKRTKAMSMLTISSTGDWRAFNQYFGIGDIDSTFKKGEILNKFNNYLQYKRRGTMDRVYPTFKLFFLQSDSPMWNSFDDFYTYDAVSDISVVESKHAASKTAVIKLSNVTSKLTNKPYNDLLNEGDEPLQGKNINIKVGAEIMILMGYGGDYRQLRMKFKGAITEIRPGVIMEITAQSWGAGLLNRVGKVGGVKHSALQGATTLGSVILDILAQTPGLGKLGRWSFRDSELNDPTKVSETILRRAYWARAINSAIGWLPSSDLIPQNTNIGDIIGGYFDSQENALPTSGAAYLSKRRQNDVIVSSFGNSLYDNIIINNSKPKGYGLWNLFQRISDSKNWGFQWYIFNQTAWDALHEVALFMGDYIITTLPYNEGQDVFGNPPRETLYFGPREHMYKASDYRPSIDTESIIRDMVSDYNKTKIIVDNSTNTLSNQRTELDTARAKLKKLKDEEGSSEDIAKTEDLINSIRNNIANTEEAISLYKEKQDEFFKLGQRALSAIITKIFKFNDFEDDYWHWNSFLDILSDTLKSSGFNKYHELIFDKIRGEGGTYWANDVERPSARHGIVVYLDNHNFAPVGGYTSESPEPNTGGLYSGKDLSIRAMMSNLARAGRLPGPLYGHVHDIFCRDYEKNLLDKSLIRKNIQGVPISTALLDYINSLSDPSINVESKYSQHDIDSSKSFNPPSSLSLREVVLNKDYIGDNPTIKRANKDYDIDLRYLDPYTSESFFYTSDIDYTSISLLQHMLPIGFVIEFLRKQEQVIMEDMFEILKRHIEGKRTGIPSTDDSGNSNYMKSVIEDIEMIIAETRGISDTFTYKSVVQYHTLDSYNDILHNGIIATSDQMYNHVEVFYMDEPNVTTDPDEVDHKASAMISYDQDADYLRTYTTYMKNLDPNIFISWSEANAYLGAKTLEQDYDNSKGALMDAFLPTPNLIAQNVLMNTIRPMYQGNLTILGNPNIRPWDIVYIYDDTTGMYGPVEVEQVINTISVNGGYTTTIIPNLLVYKKNAMKAVDQTIMDIMSKFAHLNAVGTGIANALLLGTVWFSHTKWLKPWLTKSALLNHPLTKGAALPETKDLNKTRKSIGRNTRIINKLEKALKNSRGMEVAIGDNANVHKKLKKDQVKEIIDRIKKRQVSLRSEASIKISSMRTRGGMAAFGLRILNWGMWAYTAYEVIDTAWDTLETYSTHKINMANLLAGENFLTMVPLTYQGANYVAGMEGIVSTPRSFSTIVYGELKGKEGKNRALYILGTLGEQVIAN